jgi:hypothetical protein
MTTNKKLKLTELKVGSKAWEAFPAKLVDANLPDKVAERGYALPRGYTAAWVASYLREIVHWCKLTTLEAHAWAVYRAAEKHGMAVSLARLTDYERYLRALDEHDEKCVEEYGEECSPGCRYLDDESEVPMFPRWSSEDGEPTDDEVISAIRDEFASVVDPRELVKYALFTLRLRFLAGGFAPTDEDDFNSDD